MVGSSTIYPSTIKFSCSVGYNLIGSSSRTCGETGVWSGSQPFCQSEISCNPSSCLYTSALFFYIFTVLLVVNCGSLVSPQNGTKSGGGSTTYQSTVRFSCIAGYKLIGSSSRTCNADGIWTGRQPVCERQSLTLSWNMKHTVYQNCPTVFRG